MPARESWPDFSHELPKENKKPERNTKVCDKCKATREEQNSRKSCSRPGTLLLACVMHLALAKGLLKTRENQHGRCLIKEVCVLTGSFC